MKELQIWVHGKPIGGPRIERSGQIFIEAFLWLWVITFVCLGLHSALRKEYAHYQNLLRQNGVPTAVMRRR